MITHRLFPRDKVKDLERNGSRAIKKLIRHHRRRHATQDQILTQVKIWKHIIRTGDAPQMTPPDFWRNHP